MPQSLKTVAYYRVSTDRQGKSGYGLEAQRETVRQFLSGRGGWPPIKELTEIESGRKADRPALQEALSACRAYGATLIVAKLDRLARNRDFLVSLINSRIDVLFCDLPEIPAGAAGWFMLQQMALIAEMEARLISERTKKALSAKVARDGQWDRKAKHHLKPGAGQTHASVAVTAKARQRANDLAPVVREIQAAGITSLRAIGAELGRRGILSPRGGAWTAEGVRNLLAKTATISTVARIGRLPVTPER